MFQELQKGEEDEEVGGGGEGKCLCWPGRVQDKWEGGLLLSPVADGAMNILYDLRLRRQPGCVAPRRCCHGRQTHREACWPEIRRIEAGVGKDKVGEISGTR